MSQEKQTELLGDIASDLLGEVGYTASNFDAFGRLRVSEPKALFDSKLIYGKCPYLWSEELIGTGASTHITADSCVEMDVSADGDAVIRQTKQRFNYQPSKSQLVFMTGILHTVADTEARLGYFQGSTSTPFAASDGICFESIDGVQSVAIFKGGTATRVVQSAWNGDKLDGTGASGLTIDWSKAQIFGIDLEWLGVGAVRMFIVSGGVYYIVHTFTHQNALEAVYMKSGSQPLRYEIRSSGGTAQMKHICSSVSSEGGQEPTGFVFFVDNEGEITLGTDLGLIVAVRINGNTDTVVEQLAQSISVTTANAKGRFVVLFNPTITGTPDWVQYDDLNLEYWKGTGAETVSGGLQIDGGFVNRSDTGSAAGSFGNLKLGCDIDGTKDVFALCFQTFASTADVSGSMTMRQF